RPGHEHPGRRRDGQPGRQAMGGRRTPGVPGPAGLHEGVTMKCSPQRLLAGLAAAIALAGTARAQQQELPVPPAIQALARTVAAELAANCPLADAGDIAAFSACRAALHGDSALRANVPAVLLWGRQN